MKNKLFLMIPVIMVCSLCACGQQETGTMTNTGNSIEQGITSEDNSELATAEDNNMDTTVENIRIHSNKVAASMGTSWFNGAICYIVS